MRLIFAAGDVGGARALAPVAHLAARSGHQVWVVKHGAIATDHENQNVIWNWVDPSFVADNLLTELNPDIVVFASSVTDTMALELALTAQNKGLPTAHILDNWSNYAARLVHPSGQRLTPGIYTVMDDLAAQSAVADGLSPNSVVITGTPALASVTPQTPHPSGHVIFASEPVSMDQGSDPDKPGYRGYTEDQVLKMLLQELQPWADQVDLHVFPHPREDPAGLATILQRHSGRVHTKITPPGEKATVRAAARAIVGMSSILLYDSWLAGLPTLSLQPGLRLPHLRYLEGRPGLFTVDHETQVATALSQLLGPCSLDHQHSATHERARHHGASQRVLTALSDYLRAKANG